MVKLTGPALSTAASGKLAGSLIFSTNKGRAYVKKHAKPRQPRTGKQTSMRAMMRFLSENWTLIPANGKATWTSLATPNNVTNFNAYQRYNLNRWHNFLPPSESFPAHENQNHASLPKLTCTGAVRHVLLRMQHTVMVLDNWGCMIFAEKGGIPDLTFANLIHIVRYAAVAEIYWTNSPLATGLWGYRMAFFSFDGKHDYTQTDTDTATVT